MGLLNPAKTAENDERTFITEMSIPYGLSFLATHNYKAFVPGINDIIDGVSYDEMGEKVNTISYAERIARGKSVQEALASYHEDVKCGGDSANVDSLKNVVSADFKYLGYGYLEKPTEAVPDVPLTFYTFHVMVLIGGYLLVFLLVALLFAYKPHLFKNVKLTKWWHRLAIVTIPLTYICSMCGWIVAEVGRQPWTIQDLMPNKVAISDLSAGYVQTTFWIFAVIFTALLIADISIICRQISKKSKTDLNKA